MQITDKKVTGVRFWGKDAAAERDQFKKQVLAFGGTVVAVVSVPGAEAPIKRLPVYGLMYIHGTGSQNEAPKKCSGNGCGNCDSTASHV